MPKDLLQGLTIVLTGVFEELGREKLENFLKTHGARCTGSVSGKTDYLIMGHKLEDGREVTQGNKYKKAVAKDTTILTESQFEKLIKDLSGNQNF